MLLDKKKISDLSSTTLKIDLDNLWAFTMSSSLAFMSAIFSVQVWIDSGKVSNHLLIHTGISKSFIYFTSIYVFDLYRHM